MSLFAHEPLLLRACGLTAAVVRNSSLVRFNRSAPTNTDPAYQAHLKRNRDRKRKLKQDPLAVYHRRYAKRLRKANLAIGLTTHGKVRQKRGRITKQEAVKSRKAYDRRRMDAFRARGLTTNGTPRKIKSKYCPDFVKAKP